MNFHYELTKKYARVIQTLGFYTGYIYSENVYNHGHNIVAAPEYMLGLQNGVFAGMRYIHRYIPEPLPDFGYVGEDITVQGVHHLITLEAFTGWEIRYFLFSLSAGYIPVFDWWQFWFGFTFHGVLRNGQLE